MVGTLVGLSAPVAAAAQPKGQGTLLIKQNTDCSGTGNAASVCFPFGGLFTGFAPNTTGTATAYTQPGGVQVGQRTVTVDSLGNRCELVTGTGISPGQYKIVYSFGSGTGKQKVIRVVAAPPSPTPSETPSGSASETPTPPESSAPGTPTASTPADTATPSETSSPGASQTSPPGTLVPPETNGGSAIEGERIEFTPQADPVGDAAVLARTGGDANSLTGIAAGLLLSGGVLVLVARRRGRHA